MNNNKKKYKAACNCMNITYYFYTLELPKNWMVRTCNCTFCKKYNSHIYCSDPKGKVEFYFENLDIIKFYNHGTHSADFLVCKCNSYVGSVMKTKKGIYAVLNIEFLIGNIRTPNPYRLLWKNEDKDIRLSRRLKTWTPVTRY